MFFLPCSVRGFYTTSYNSGKTLSLCWEVLKANEHQNKHKYCLLLFSLCSVGILYGHFPPGAEDVKDFMTLVCRFIFLFVPALGVLTLKRFFEGRKGMCWVMVRLISKDGTWIMHVVERSPSGSSRTWIVDDQQRGPWTVPLWGIFIYLSVQSSRKINYLKEKPWGIVFCSHCIHLGPIK